MNEPKPKRILILGAGITGLAAAYDLCRKIRAHQPAFEVLVLEASNRVGGKVLTEAKDGVIFEAGPDSFLSTKPEVLQLAQELGLSSDLLATNPAQRAVSIYSQGKLQPLPWKGIWPTSAWPIVSSGLLSWRGKLRAALWRWRAKEKGDRDVSLAEFIRGHLGPEMLEKIAGPLLAGIYAGDPENLSLESTFPQLRDMLSTSHFSLFTSPSSREKGEVKSEKSLFMTFKGGLSRLTTALALALPGQTIRTGIQVTALRRTGACWEIETQAGTFGAEIVISTLPANALAPLLENADIEFAHALREIPFASTATASVVYKEQGFPGPLAGHGFLVPRTEGRKIIAATYSSNKFPGRTPQDKLLIRCFLGGAGRNKDAEESEEQIAQTTMQELGGILKLNGVKPEAIRVWKWLKANPQYNVGHKLRIERISSCLKSHPGLILAGCSYHGVGLPDCVRSGRTAAEMIFSAHGRTPSGIA